MSTETANERPHIKIEMDSVEVDYVRHSLARDNVKIVDTMGSDARVVNAARVSMGKEIDEGNPLRPEDEKLIGYLANNDHDSPFFHCIVYIRISMPIFLAREWFRHTVGFSRNEVSRRYVTQGIECFLPEMVREKHPIKKQGSKDVSVADNDGALSVMEESMKQSIVAYRRLLEMGAAPEHARIVLPQSMMTEFVESASLMAYARLYRLRNSPHAQTEIRQYAIEIGRLLAPLFPVAWAALTKDRSVNAVVPIPAPIALKEAEPEEKQVSRR